MCDLVFSKQSLISAALWDRGVALGSLMFFGRFGEFFESGNYDAAACKGEQPSFFKTAEHLADADSRDVQSVG